MKKKLKFLLVLFMFGLTLTATVPINAQCAMCTATVETNSENGGAQAKGLNKGIMYLLAAPYLAVAVLGFIWYKKYRRKNVDLSNMPNQKLNLN